MSGFEWYGMALVSAAFGMLFVLGEYLRRRRRVNPELTRKLVHFGGCLVALSFPLFFTSFRPVLLLAIGFTALIVCGANFRFLHSIHDVDRDSAGGVYHPIAIFVCFLIALLLGHWVLYEIAIMVLALSDSMAALVGKTYGQSKYQVDAGSTKSVEGSVIFFLSTFLIVEIALLLGTGIGRVECILVALLIALLVTLFEAISLNGSDNLFIPLGTEFILAKNLAPSVGELGFQLAVLAAAFLLLHVIVRPYRRIALSGYIALALAAYTAWGLVNFYWMLPILYGAWLICRTDRIIAEPEDSEHQHRILRVFYLLAIPVLWLLAANLTGKLYGIGIQCWFFPSFATALTGQLLIARAGLMMLRGGPYPAFRQFGDHVLYSLPVAAMALPVFGVGLLPQWGVLSGVAILCSFLGAMLYRAPADPARRVQPWQLRVRMAVILTVSALPLAVAYLFYCQPVPGGV